MVPSIFSTDSSNFKVIRRYVLKRLKHNFWRKFSTHLPQNKSGGACEGRCSVRKFLTSEGGISMVWMQWCLSAYKKINWTMQ